MTEALAALLVRSPTVVPANTLLVVIAGLMLLAAIDVWREEVEDWAIAALLGIAVIGLHLEGILAQQWVGAVLAASVAFLIYLNLGQRGVLGGGDVKLSVVPAFVLGAANPLAGVWWIAGAILIHQALFVIIARTRRSREAIPHVPAMAAATWASTFVFMSIM